MNISIFIGESESPPRLSTNPSILLNYTSGIKKKKNKKCLSNIVINKSGD